jgi:nucleoside-diphosphate-sugar epimerase
MHNDENHIIFGSGQLGLAIMDELVAQGKRVTIVNRSGQVNETLPDNVTLLQADLTDPDQVASAVGDAAVVFQTAQPAYTQWPQQFPPLMKSIIAGVSQSDAKLIVADNLYMYGPANGRPLTEDLPYAATGHKGRTRAQLATMLLDAHQNGRIRVAIGRASDFYGPRVTDSAVGEMLFAAALEGKPANMLGNPELPHTYTYIRDFARGLVVLSEHEEALGRAWHIPSAETITTRQFVNLVAEEVDRPVQIRIAPRFLLTVLGLFNPLLREMKEMLYEFEEPYIVDHSQFAHAFAATTTPHQQAIEETIAWYMEK